jgi:hypothetical protein
MEGPVNRIPSPKLLDTRPKLVVSRNLHLAVANDTRIIAQVVWDSGNCTYHGAKDESA